MRKSINILIIIFLAFISACQCPTDIDTPRIIEPDNSANVLFINATNKGDLDVFSSDVLVYDNLKYLGSSYTYKKTQAGVDLLMVKISESGKNMLNIPIDMKKDDYYTLIFYDISSIINFILISDTYNTNSSHSQLRLINSSVIYPHLLFKIETGDSTITNDLNMLSNTAFLEQNSGNYKISVIETTSDKVIATIDNYEFKQNSAYSIIFRTNSSVPDLLIVEHKKI
ncbi:MAG: hypothetical protein WCR42_01875 [bacterium]